MRSDESIQPRWEAIQLQRCEPGCETCFWVTKFSCPKRVLRLGVDGGQPKLPLNEKRVLLVSGPFTSQCRLILSPHAEQDQPQLIGDLAPKLPLDEPAIPSRSPAVAARALHGLPEYSRRYSRHERPQIHRPDTRQFPSRTYPARVRLCIVSLGFPAMPAVLLFETLKLLVHGRRLQPHDRERRARHRQGAITPMTVKQMGAPPIRLRPTGAKVSASDAA